MDLNKQNLTRLKPIRFPAQGGGNKVVPVKLGKPTREVIAEMRKLSKKDFFVAE